MKLKAHILMDNNGPYLTAVGHYIIVPPDVDMRMDMIAHLFGLEAVECEVIVKKK